MRFEELTAAKS